ncbi:Uncharacterised protein [Serratia plymuthica]|nr:hypothetical protein ADP72_03115 [Serratia plymuthica]KYG14873.1 hypothetical protein SOD10_40470 [Serratia plymuthica]KYG16462.1 hypothetical protein SOD10_24130 [Serratia plymuthica]CAI0917009.1 Uncharacterised protein [Serratia plymuthica]
MQSFRTNGIFFRKWMRCSTSLFMIFTAVNYIGNSIHGGDLYFFLLIVFLCLLGGFAFVFFNIINVKDDEK